MSSNETASFEKMTDEQKMEERLKMMRHFHRHHPRRFLFAPLVLVFFAAKAGVIMYLWNALIPQLFSGPMLNFPKALGLMVLAKLLVGGGFHFAGKGPWGRHYWGEHKRFWHGMSFEERQKLRHEFKKRLKEGRL